MLTAQNLQNLLPEFINHLISTNSSRSTVKNYVSDLRRVLEKLPAETQLDNSHISAALAILKADFSESTIRRFGYSLKAFTNWLALKGYDLNKVEQVLPITTVNVSEVIKVSPIQTYVEHIQEQGAPESTTKQYRSDLNSFFAWLKPAGSGINQKVIDHVSRIDINRYTSFLKAKQVSPASINRYLYSLKDFFNFHKEDIVYETNPVNLTRPGLVNGGRFWQRFKVKKPRWWHAYRGHPMSEYVNWAASAGAVLVVGLLVWEGLFAPKPLDITNLKTEIQKGFVLAATPPRILSFQGRLTDPSGNPVTAATNIVYRIYTSTSGDTGSPCANTCLWESKTWSVTPDQNGIFSVQLGDTGQADTAIPASLFSDNSTLYLGVKIGADAEATPRQRIASSSYALNSDSLDGIDSLSFLRSDTTDNFISGTLTFDSGTTLTGADGSTTNINSSTIAIGNTTGDTITVNGVPTFTTDTNFTLLGTENVAMTSDLAGTVDVISIIGTPSASAGTTQGLFIQQAASANTNGLDVGIAIDNADDSVAIADGLNFSNSGGGGYTNFLNTPTIDITGAGAITGATGLTSSGTITFSTMITDANAVLYTTTGGVVTRVVETETGSQCLLSGAGASGIPVWGACPGGSFSGEVDTTTNGSLTFTSDDASPPAGTVNSIFRDNTGDLNINAVSGKTINLQIAGADEYNFSSTGLAFNSNNITGLGTNLTAAAGLTIGTGSAGNITLTPDTTGVIIASSATASGNAFALSDTALTTGKLAALSFTSALTATGTTTTGLQISPTIAGTAAANAYTTNSLDLTTIAGACPATATCRNNAINIGSYAIADADQTSVVINIADQYNATGTHYGICFDCNGATYNNVQPANGIQWGNDANAVTLYRGIANTGPYLISTGQIFIPDGAVNSPAFGFTNRTNLGLYRATVGGLTNRMSFVANGQPALGIDGDSGVGRFFVGDPAGGTIVSRIQTWDDGGTATSGISLGVTSPVQLFRSANNTLSLGTTTTMTAGGALTISSGAAGLTLDSADGRVAIATGDFLKTSVAGVTGAAAGDIWYDTNASKFKIYEATGPKILCNLTDGACGGGSQTPWTSDIDADNFSLLDFGPNLTSRAATTIGSANNGAGASGLVTLNTGTGTTATGGITLVTGNASAGTAGNISLDVGTSTSGNGSILIGTAARAQTITIGNSTGGTITFGGLTSCASLTTNGSGVVSCGSGLPDSAFFTDSTGETVAYTSANDVWDGTQPNMTPTATSQGVLIAVTIQLNSDEANDEEPEFHVRRNIGSAAACTSTIVGTDFWGTFRTTSGQQTAASATFIDYPSTTSQVNYTICTSGSGSDDGTIGTITVALLQVGADLAENYYTRDGTIVAGDIVSIDPAIPSGTAKSGRPYDNQVLGAVSTKPGKILDDGFGAGYGRPIPVALVGRVPVKVTTENGPIRPGDLITSSSVAGVGMKASKPGYVLGRALTSFDGAGQGMVVVFVNTHYADPQKLIELDPSVAIASASPTAATSSALISLDSDNNLVATISAGLKFAWENSAGQVVAWVSDTGEAFFKSVTAALGEFTKLVFGEAVVKKEAKTAGEASFAQNETEVFVESDKITEESLVNITASTKTGGLSLYVKEKKTGEGFVVALERNSGDLPDQATASAAQAIKFTWFVLNQQ